MKKNREYKLDRYEKELNSVKKDTEKWKLIKHINEGKSSSLRYVLWPNSLKENMIERRIKG